MNLLLENLELHPWDITIPKLITYTSKKIKRLFWRSIYGGHLPEGREAADVVNQAIEKVFSGKRQWDMGANPDLFVYLIGVIDSDLSHLTDCENNRRERTEATLIAGIECDEVESDINAFDKLIGTIRDPEAMLIQQEEEAQCEKFFLDFYESLSDKPLLQKIVECIWDDTDKPAAIAEKLGEPVENIYNARKQLNRRLDEFRKESGLRKFK